MFKVRVRYGVDTEEMESDRPITTRAIKGNEDLRARLGFGDRINITLNGVTLADDHIIPNDSLVVAETAANTKATNELVAA